MEMAYEAIQQSTGFFSVEAEESLISALISGASLSDKEGFASQLKSSDFGVPDNAEIFKAICKVLAKRQNPDLITVDAEIAAAIPEQSEILRNKIIDIVRTRLATRFNADGYISVIRELSARRMAIRSVQEALRKLTNPTKDLNEIMDNLTSMAVNTANTKGFEWTDMSNVLLQTYENLEKRFNGQIKPITTGLHCVDKIIGGFYAGELTIIGARPAVGKSAFAINIALEAAEAGYSVGVVSREMSAIQFGQRLLSRQSGINGMDIRSANITDAQWENLGLAMSELSSLPLSFVFSIQNVEDLRRECIKLKRKKSLDLLVVDYLQLMQTTVKTDKDYLRVGRISKALKDIAMELDIPVIALSQVRRDADGQMPNLADLKDSGSIEQDADGVIFLHKPNSPDDTSVNAEDKPYWGEMKERGLTYLSIGVAKQRQGAIGKTNVAFDSARMRYLEIDRGI